MNDTIPTQTAVFLMVLWFYAGRQMGHVFAKYARAKKSSKIIAIVLSTLALIITAWVTGKI